MIAEKIAYVSNKYHPVSSIIIGIDNMFGLFPVSGTQTPSNWSDGGYKFYFTGTTVYGTLWVQSN